MSVSQESKEAAGHTKTLVKSDEDGDCLNLSNKPTDTNTGSQKHGPPSPVPSCVSMKSDQSMPEPRNFSSEPPQSDPTSQKNRPPSPVPSCVSMKSDQSMPEPRNFSSEPPQSDPTELRSDMTQDQSRCGVCERVLGDPVITTCGHSFCRQCISSYWEQPGLPGDQACPQCGKTCRTQPPLQPLLDEHTDMVESSRHLHIEHTPDRRNKLADEVLRRVIEKHKASLKRRFENISEGIIKPGAETPLNKIYTELYITEGESDGVNKEHEVWQVESASRAQTTEDTPINCNDIFKPLTGQEKDIRTVMTKGVAGIGKTVSVQKFILDWIDGVANENVDLMFPLSFRELNLVKGDQYSLHNLLLDFHPELKELKNDEEYNNCQIVFIFDGLDESRLPLNFQQNMISDLKQTSSVDVLMTSLIQGTLLPSAHIWITSRPAAASQIPAQCIDQVTEVRGFNDQQKEEYFRKKITVESQASIIISHIKASRILHIMCHIPVFCWIAATVLQQMLEQDNTQEIPKTLTEMFIHFLLIQTTRKNQKYQSGSKDQLLESQDETILKLAKLAFKNLENGNVMFYEEDLKKCGIDLSEASVYSGMCTEIFKEESVFQQKKVYSFVHLSIQEFLSALHVFVSYSNQMETIGTFFCLEESLKLAVTKVLESRNGQLDLFLCFLMGISVESNQRLLQGLLKHIHNSSESIKNTCQYIKELNTDNISPERCISLLQCLSEVNDHSNDEEVQHYLKSPKGFREKLSPSHCSALAHMLLMSEEVLDEFDLKTYNTSDEGRRRMIAALGCCRTAKLDGCELNKMSCETVKRSMQSANSLIQLDLSRNSLGDSGVQILSAGLTSPHCKLQTLRLAECLLTDMSCGFVATVLKSPNSQTELDLGNNDLGDSGVELLFNGLSSPECKLQTLRLAKCTLTDKSCGIVATVLQSPNSLTELDLSKNDLGYSEAQLLFNGLSSSHCKLLKLRLAECLLTDKSCGFMATVLQSPNSLTELDLSNNDLRDSGIQLLSKGLSSPHCKLQTLKFAECTLTDESFKIVATVLLSSNFLTELDLSKNYLGDSGVQLLFHGLSSPNCKLKILRLAECTLTDKSCGIVAAVLQSPNYLIELDLSKNELGDPGVQLVCNGLSSVHCKLQTLRLAECTLTDKSCQIVATVLQSPNSLIELDLSKNDLGYSGVQLVSNGLSSLHCKLQTLRLCSCRISNEGYVCLALTLMLSPSCVKELDVSNNHPGESAKKLLSSILEDPHRKVEALQLAECRLTDKSCRIVATVLQSQNFLTELDLSNNDLGDSGVQLLSSGLSSPHCNLQTLRLCNCQISNEGYVCLALTLMVNPSCVKDLDVSNNHPGESAQKLLSSRLEDPRRKVEALQLAGCKLTDKSCEIVATVLKLPNHLIELDLSNNDLGDSGVQLLSNGLFSPHCNLQTLRLAECTLTDKSCVIVAAVLQSPNSLTELDLSNNDLGDSGVKLFSNGLSSKNCKLQTLRFAECTLTYTAGGILATVLQSPNSLTKLDLSNNDLGDSGVHLLSKGLCNPHCNLQTLRLSDCLISEKGCNSLASALTSNPSHLKELDLSYNYPGQSELKLLSVRLKDPVCKLKKLTTDPVSVSRARPRLLRYACELTLDPNTAGRNLSLSEGNRKVTFMRNKQPYSDQKERWWNQVLCREGLSERYYWEAEWSGPEAEIALVYKSCEMKGQSIDRQLGYNDKSWSLDCSPRRYYARHNNKHTSIPPPSSKSRRVGVYLDWPAGTLSFYSVSSDTLTHLHTFNSTFTESLYPGFYIFKGDSSVSLCQIT